jgi:hypothetical protein
MSARLLALLCLALVGVAPALPESNALVVYLTPPTTRDALVQAHMRREAVALMRSAGYTLEFRDRTARRSGDSAPNLAFIDLMGSCAVAADPTPGPPPDDNQPKLASTAVEDGVVLPFSRIDCGAMTRVLSRLLAREAPAERAFLYGRAMARVLAHELYHVLAQTRDHAAEGIGKPCFTAADLVSSRFEFEATALARLRRISPITTGSDSESGR